MQRTIELHFNKRIIEQVQFKSGFSFETWLVTLEDGSKVVFRTGKDSEIENGKKFIVSDIFDKEMHFYETVNRNYPNRCPEILLIDRAMQVYNQPYQIMSYISGNPLDSYLPEVNEVFKNKIYYAIGRMTAEINAIEIDTPHFLFESEKWESRFKESFSERLSPLLKDSVINDLEKEQLLKLLGEHKAEKTNSLLHLDIRLPNLIFNEGFIHLIDAENCTVGDPLYELAVVSVAGLLNESFLNGYSEACGFKVILESEIFKFYQFERLAALVNLFQNIIKNNMLANNAILSLNKLKDDLLRHKN